MMKTGLPMYFHLSSLDNSSGALVCFLNIDAILTVENDYAL